MELNKGLLCLHFFSSYMDDLFERLKRKCYWLPCWSSLCLCVWAALSLYSLRCMIACTCEEFANEYQIDFNPTKSKLIYFNANIDHAPHIILNGQPVSVVF